jgi:nitrogen fixation NifU-like protein
MSSLYRQHLLDQYKNLKHKGNIADANHHLPAINPSCGDHLTIELLIDDDKVIQKAGFYGDGCMISLVATDLILDNLIGKKFENIEKINIKQIEKWLGHPLTVGRYNCATVALEPLHKI